MSINTKNGIRHEFGITPETSDQKGRCIEETRSSLPIRYGSYVQPKCLNACRDRCDVYVQDLLLVRI